MTMDLTEGSCKNEHDVTIIIVNWNLKEYLQKCLNSIYINSEGISVEVLVVDNASTDGSCEFLKSNYPDVMVICNHENEGFSKANNQAIERAKGRYYFLLNNDAVLFENALSNLIEFMDNQPGAGLCGPLVVNEDYTLQVRSKGRYPSIRTALGHFFLPSALQRIGRKPLGFYENRDLSKVQEIDWVSGCAMMVRRQAVEEVGLLDADVFMYCEDVDWCYRMTRAGWGVFYVPTAKVLHYAGKSMQKQKGKVVGAHKAGLLAFYSKHHKKIPSKTFEIVILLGYGIRAIGWIATAMTGQNKGWDKIRRLIPRNR